MFMLILVFIPLLVCVIAVAIVLACVEQVESKKKRIASLPHIETYAEVEARLSHNADVIKQNSEKVQIPKRTDTIQRPTESKAYVSDIEKWLVYYSTPRVIHDEPYPDWLKQPEPVIIPFDISRLRNVVFEGYVVAYLKEFSTQDKDSEIEMERLWHKQVDTWIIDNSEYADQSSTFKEQRAKEFERLYKQFDLDSFKFIKFSFTRTYTHRYKERVYRKPEIDRELEYTLEEIQHIIRSAYEKKVLYPRED